MKKSTKVSLLGVVLVAMLVLAVIMGGISLYAAGRSRGDVNQDNQIDMKDVLAMRRHIAGQSVGLDVVLADTNGDNEIDMKDVLLLRKHIANMPVSFAPLSEDSSVVSVTSTTSVESTVSVVSTASDVSAVSDVSTVNTTTTTSTTVSEVSTVSETSDVSVVSQPEPSTTTTIIENSNTGDEVTLTLNFLQLGKYENENVHINKSWTYNRNQTAEISVSFSLYNGAHKTQEEVLAYVQGMAGCTFTGFTEGAVSDHLSPYTLTYTIVMDSNKTVTGQSGAKELIYTIEANGQSNGNDPTTSSSTSSSSSSTSQTTTTTRNSTPPPVGEGYYVQLDIDEESPRYTVSKRSDYWEVEKDSTVTFEVVFTKIYKGNEVTDWAPYLNVYANGQSLTPEFSYGPVSNQTCDVTATMTFVASADTTITGTIHHPSYGKFVARVNGAVGVGGVTGGLEDVLVYSSQTMLFDQVYLSFYDMDCSTYGVAWHTYQSSNTPVLQYVEGMASSASDFASASTISATTSMVDNGFIYADYNPANNGLFTTTERIDGLPDYTHKAHFPQLKANTTYSYRVGDTTKGDYSQIYTFTTKSNANNGFTFGYTSDSQWSSDNAQAGIKYKTVLDSMLGLSNVSFLMHGGDVVDVVGAIHLWGNQMGSNSSNFFAKIPTFAATGNHDSSTAILEHFNLNTPTAWYSFDYQNSHFIVLDNGTSTYDVHLGDAQLGWLTNDLNTAKTKNYDWIIVSFHKPLYCPKQWNQNKDSYSVIAHEEGKTNRRDELTNLFVDVGVDLVLQAHTHQYGRSYPIIDVDTYQTNFTTSTQNGVSYFGNVQGPIYTVMSTACEKGDPAIGTATGSYQSSNGTTYYENDYMAVTADGEDYSFGIIQVESNRLTVSVYHDGTQLYEKFGIVK